MQIGYGLGPTTPQAFKVVEALQAPYLMVIRKKKSKTATPDAQSRARPGVKRRKESSRVRAMAGFY